MSYVTASMPNFRSALSAVLQAPPPWVLAISALLACVPGFLLLFPTDWLQARGYLLDGSAFYCAGHAARAGLNPYDPAVLHDCAVALGKIQTDFFYLPVSLVLFVPLSLLTFPSAMMLLMAANMLGLAIGYILLFKLFQKKPVHWNLGLALLIGLSFSFCPFYTFAFGQTNLAAFGAGMLFLSCWLSGRNTPAILCLLLAVMFKPQFAVLGLLLLQRLNWRLIITGTGAFLFSILFIFLTCGPAPLTGWLQDGLVMQAYPTFVRLPNWIEAGGSGWSFLGLLGRTSLSLDQRTTAIYLFAALALGASILRVMSLRAWSNDEDGSAVLYGFSLLLLLAGLISPISWIAYFIFLLPFLFWLVFVEHKLLPALLLAIMMEAVLRGYLVVLPYLIFLLVLGFVYMLLRPPLRAAV